MRKFLALVAMLGVASFASAAPPQYPVITTTVYEESGLNDQGGVVMGIGIYQSIIIPPTWNVKSVTESTRVTRVGQQILLWDGGTMSMADNPDNFSSNNGTIEFATGWFGSSDITSDTYTASILTTITYFVPGKQGLQTYSWQDWESITIP